MQVIEAISLTNNVNVWLAETRHPRILHVFDNVCNLINERREVLSIVTTQIGNGPFLMVVEDEVLFSKQLNLEAQISLSPTKITLGDMTISTEGGQLWDPNPDWDELHLNKDKILNQLQLINYQNRAFDIGFVNIVQPDLTTTGLQYLLSSFVSSLVNNDISTAKATTSKLAGLGVGLTPSGDDFIMGALYAGWIIHPHKIASPLALAIADIAVPLTTALSAAWIRSAGMGNAAVVWHVLFEDLISDNTFRIQKSCESILAIGETSGADALNGFISGFMCQTQP